ncbi:MAG: hypothetical protein ACJA1A_002582, partial [Saprospiraceae bacterium]
YSEVSLDEPIRDSLFMYEMSTVGEIIWKRRFSELVPTKRKND